MRSFSLFLPKSDDFVKLSLFYFNTDLDLLGTNLDRYLPGSLLLTLDLYYDLALLGSGLDKLNVLSGYLHLTGYGISYCLLLVLSLGNLYGIILGLALLDRDRLPGSLDLLGCILDIYLDLCSLGICILQSNGGLLTLDSLLWSSYLDTGLGNLNLGNLGVCRLCCHTGYCCTGYRDLHVLGLTGLYDNRLCRLCDLEGTGYCISG